DGGLAIDAQVESPNGIAVDATGNVFFADRLAHKVRRISPDGIITTVVGNGVDGSSNGNGQAINSNLNRPYDVAVAPGGRLYVADTGNSRLQVVEPNGTVWTTLATSSGVWFVEV